MGSGIAIKGKGICEAVELMLNGWGVVESFLPLELGGVDIIIGRHWLHLSGVAEMVWRNLTMTFYHENNKVVIRGDSSLTKTRVCLKSMIKSWTNSYRGFLIEYRPMEEE